MRRFTVFAILLLAVYMIGCTVDESQIKNRHNSPAGGGVDTRVSSKDTKAQQRDKIPFVLGISKYNDKKTEVIEEQALLCFAIGM